MINLVFLLLKLCIQFSSHYTIFYSYFFVLTLAWLGVKGQVRVVSDTTGVYYSIEIWDWIVNLSLYKKHITRTKAKR